MAATPSIDSTQFLEEQLAAASPDLLRAMLTTFVEALMGAEADAICGAAYGERSPQRTNCRNGYRARDWDPRAGTIELAIPKLRAGSYFPDWLLERRRAELALITVVATSYLLGVSTRRVERLVETLGITRLSKSQVSEMAKSLDAQVAAFRSRPLDVGPYPFVWLDALTGEGARGRADRARPRPRRDRRQRRRLPRGARTRRRRERGRGGVARVPALAGGPRPVRRRAGDLRRPPGARRGDRRDAARGELAKVPDALRPQPVDPGRQVRPALGADAAAHG